MSRRADGATAVARIGAMARRDAVIQLSYPVQLATQIGNVFFSAVLLYFIAKLVGRPPSLAAYEGDYFSFAVTGLLVMSFASLGLTTFSGSIAAEQVTGSLEALLVSPTRLATM